MAQEMINRFRAQHEQTAKNSKIMKKTLIRLSFLATLALATIGCQSHTVQTTSGREYLNEYADIDLPNGKAGSIDEEVREIANVEPTLRFPARIGLAKLYNGRITNLSVEEVEGWDKAKEEMGSEFGEFVPVSSMIAELVYTAPPREKRHHEVDASEIFRKVRLGAARQHLDYVVLYEVFSETKTTKLASSVANWTIIGGYFIPSRKIETTGHANSLLLDVRSGYPYGTASASLTADELSAWHNNWDKSRNLQDKNQVATALKLIPEARKMMEKLMQNLNQT
jgi:hypothetical protein